jgi:hypothetical protein
LGLVHLRRAPWQTLLLLLLLVLCLLLLLLLLPLALLSCGRPP